MERASSPNASAPSLVMNRTSVPSRRAPIAWLAPFPPGPRSKWLPATVSPGAGSLVLYTVMLAL